MLLSACGSTAIQDGSFAAGGDGSYVVGENGELLAVDPVTGEVLDGSVSADGLGSPVAGGPAAVGGGRGAGSQTTATSPAGGAGATAPGGAPSAGQGGWVSEPGAGPLKVGIMTADVGAIFAAFGQDAPDGGSVPFEQAFQKYVNAKGGLAGRPMEIVSSSVSSTDDAATAAQRTCAAFTQDQKVDVVVNTLGGSEILATCLKAAGVAMIDGATVAPDAAVAAKFPNWIIPSAMRSDRIAAAQIQQALSSGILERGDNLGVLIEDCPSQQRVRDSVVKPLAAKAGVKVTDGAFQCVQNLVQGLAGVSNDVQRETLRFATAGVTHVMIVSAAEAFAFSNFTSTASQQKYFPEYLVSSSAYPWNNSRSDAVIKISADALPHIHGLGLSAGLDIGSMKPVNAAQAGAQKECATIDPSRIGVSERDANDQPFQLNLFHSACESYRVLRTVLEINGGRTAYPDVLRAFNLMQAKRVASASLASGSYTAGATGQTDGATILRPFRFDTKAGKWAYTGGPVSAP